jgi:indole-3-glycerol phosphate synthase
MSILNEILARKRQRLDHLKADTPLRDMKAAAAAAEKADDFGSAIRRSAGTPSTVRLIAEIKKASPSRGLIREDFNLRQIALVYGRTADAISVLTEEDYFRGDLKYIGEVKSVTRKPVLRKDFIIDEYQVYEARAAGADAILLIEAALDMSQADEYMQMAADLGMATLLEVHDMEGLERALEIDAGIVGINNRDLKTLNVDTGTTFKLMAAMPEGKTVVSESGIRAREDVIRLEQAGVDAMLVGSALMEAKDIEGKAIELTGKRQVQPDIG